MKLIENIILFENILFFKCVEFGNDKNGRRVIKLFFLDVLIDKLKDDGGFIINFVRLF